MQSKAKTVSEYLAELPEDRRKAIQEIRKVIKKNLPKGYRETVQYGMISYVVPLSTYPDGYLNDKETPLPYMSVASQKNHMAVYASCVYADPKLNDWFKKEWVKSGNKLDMGKSCIRFRNIDKVPLDVLGKLVAKVPVKTFIKQYEEGSGRHKKK